MAAIQQLLMADVPAAGGSYDTDAQAFFTAAGITDSTQKSAVNQLVLDLKSASIWTKMTALYPFVGGDATKHSYNLKNPATFQITWNGTVTHNANGITGDGSTGYGNTGLVPSTSLTLNDTHLCVYSRTTGTSGDVMAEMGVNTSGGTDRCTMGIRSSTFFYDHLYNTAAAFNTSSADAQGMFVVSRRASNDKEHYRNGSSVGTRTTNDTGALPTVRTLYIAAQNNNTTAVNFSNRNLALASIGLSLTDTDASNFYTAVQAFQTTLSRNV